MSDPIKFTAELPEGGILKENTAAGVANQNYGPTSATGWYNGLRTGDYTIIKAQDGESPLIYSPGSDAEVIQFCNTTISPSPSSTITTIDEALDFISTSDYMLFHGTDTIDNFPVGLPMDGLSSYLDSQINASTDVTGEWKDVSGNGLCFYIYGTQLSLTSLGGYQAFQFNDSGYYQCNDKHGAVNIGGDCTIVMWVW